MSHRFRHNIRGLPDYVKLKSENRGAAIMKLADSDCTTCYAEYYNKRQQRENENLQLRPIKCLSHSSQYIYLCISTFDIWEYQIKNPFESPELSALDVAQPPTVPDDTWNDWASLWNSYKEVYVSLSWINRFPKICDVNSVSWKNLVFTNFALLKEEIMYYNDIYLYYESYSNLTVEFDYEYEEYHKNLDHLWDELCVKRFWVHFRLYLRNKRIEVGEELRKLFETKGILEDPPNIGKLQNTKYSIPTRVLSTSFDCLSVIEDEFDIDACPSSLSDPGGINTNFGVPKLAGGGVAFSLLGGPNMPEKNPILVGPLPSIHMPPVQIQAERPHTPYSETTEYFRKVEGMVSDNSDLNEAQTHTLPEAVPYYHNINMPEDFQEAENLTEEKSNIKQFKSILIGEDSSSSARDNGEYYGDVKADRNGESYSQVQSENFQEVQALIREENDNQSQSDTPICIPIDEDVNPGRNNESYSEVKSKGFQKAESLTGKGSYYDNQTLPATDCVPADENVKVGGRDEFYSEVKQERFQEVESLTGERSYNNRMLPPIPELIPIDNAVENDESHHVASLDDFRFDLPNDTETNIVVRGGRRLIHGVFNGISYMKNLIFSCPSSFIRLFYMILKPFRIIGSRVHGYLSSFLWLIYRLRNKFKIVNDMQRTEKVCIAKLKGIFNSELDYVLGYPPVWSKESEVIAELEHCGLTIQADPTLHRICLNSEEGRRTSTLSLVNMEYLVDLRADLNVLRYGDSGPTELMLLERKIMSKFRRAAEMDSVGTSGPPSRASSIYQTISSNYSTGSVENIPMIDESYLIGGEPFMPPDLPELQQGTVSSLMEDILNFCELMEYWPSNLKDPTMPEPFKEELKPYWLRRYRLFSLHNEGINIINECWYMTPPELIAKHQAYRFANRSRRIRRNTVIDAFCGAGMNSIQFALFNFDVIAIDPSLQNMICARNNAYIYGVGHKIQFLTGNFWEMDLSEIQGDAIFLNPPRSIQNPLDNEYDLSNIIGGMTRFKEMFDAAMKITKNIALYLPAHTNIFQILELAKPFEGIEIEFNRICNEDDSLTVYFGEIKDR